MTGLLLPLGLLLWAGASRKRSPSPTRAASTSTPAPAAPTPAETAARADAARQQVRRVVTEAKEIVAGERGTFSDDPKQRPQTAESAKQVAQRVAAAAKPALDADEEARLARLAAQRAAAQETSSVPAATPPPAPRPPAPVPQSSAPVPVATQSAPAPAAAPSVPPPAVCPEGYDAAKARRAAKATANHLRNKGRSGYSRQLLRAWQRAAGIAPDGIYGGATAGALRAFGGDPPRPYFPPLAESTYSAPC